MKMIQDTSEITAHTTATATAEGGEEEHEPLN